MRLLVAILACLAIIGCAGDQPGEGRRSEGPASESASRPDVPVSVDGTWIGKTSQDRAIEVVVRDGAVSSLKVGFSLKLDAVCARPGSPVATDYRGGEADVTFGKPVPVTAGRFVVNAGISDVDAQVIGEFSSSGATGTIDLQPTPASGCSGKDRLTWSAARREASQ